jgi:hypothetical protein
LIFVARNKDKNFSSVVALPEPRIRAINAERDNPPNRVFS